MKTPVDYPIVDPARHTRFSMDELTYSVLLDRVDTTDYSANPESDQSSDVNNVKTAAYGTPSTILLKPLSTLAQSLIPVFSVDRSVGVSVFSRWSRGPR